MEEERLGGRSGYVTSDSSRPLHHHGSGDSGSSASSPARARTTSSGCSGSTSISTTNSVKQPSARADGVEVRLLLVTVGALAGLCAPLAAAAPARSWAQPEIDLVTERGVFT